MNRVRVLGLVCARGGSKGIPSKNLQLLGDKPLVAHAVCQAIGCKAVDSVVVSTDSPEIAEVAVESGASVPFLRPVELSRDDTPEWQVWQHALDWFQNEFGYLPQTVLVVPPTSPLRLESDLQACLDKIQSAEVDIVVTMTPAKRNPYFNMVQRDSDGNLMLLSSTKEKIERRQTAPEVFDLTTVAYAFRPRFVLESKGMWSGHVAGVVVPSDRAIDIDDETDLDFARLIFERQSEKGLNV